MSALELGDILQCLGRRLGTITQKSRFFRILRQGGRGYNACTMQVYAELALLENFCMDFTLLSCVKAMTKNGCRYSRIAAASVLGACFAVVYPLFGIENAVLGTAVKLISGAALCAVGGKFSRLRGYLKFTALFLAVTFLAGGALVALFSLAGADYALGQGYMLSSLPIGIPLFVLLIIALAIKRAAAKFSSAHARSAVKCVIVVGDRSAECGAFFDSGNKVHYKGAPVSVAPRAVAEKLTDVGGIKSCVEIHTVSGRAKLPVFRADRVEIDDGIRKRSLGGVLIGVSPQAIDRLVLNPDLAEVN